MILRCCIAVLIAGSAFVSASLAEEVVMTTGERFTTSKVWEENGKIRFNMHGLVVSVNKSDVATIIGKDGPPHPKAPSPVSIRPPAQPKQPATVEQQPAPSAPAPPPKSKQNNRPKTKVSGIGFSGISWHMRPTDLPGLKKIKTEEVYGGIDQYWRPDGPMTLGNVLLDGLVFGFWQNRLYTITIWVDGRPAYDGLQRVILDRYGDGKKSKIHKNRYVWVVDKTTDRMLEFDEERNVGIFWMRSRELDNHVKKIYPES